VRELVAIDLAAGPAFITALRQIWDHGDTAFPLDQRLPVPARTALLDAIRPHRLLADPATPPTALHLDAPPLADGDALVVASSGTSGAPKAVVHTHAALAAHAAAVHARLGVDPATDRWLACLPLAHVGGLGVVVRALITDTPLDVLDGFHADVVADAPTELGTTLVSLVPTALDRLDPAPFRWVVLGGSGDDRARPANVVHTYGLTETGGGVVYDGTPLPGCEVHIDGSDHIALRGPMLARGVRQPDQESLTAVVDEQGWLRTGDLGSWADDGRLEVHGRADDLIVTGAENVWPTAVEAAIGSMASVREVAVMGRPDPEWGERVVAVVVPVEADRPPSLDEVRDHVRAHLPAYAAPRELVLTDALPRSALGKIRRADLS